ncbi:MAG: Crp/Fnr family transcriptional regulator [Actinobacteria bacterium]|nr:Crp/Fnr family transcriptional regulator [Actinomycetota bacterium]
MPAIRGELEALHGRMLGTPLFTSLPKPAVRDLAEAGAVRDYRRGTYLFHQGDPPGDVFFLNEGMIEISSLSATGHRQLHTMIDQPLLFGELSVLGEMPRSATALALDDSRVWSVDGATFLGFLDKQPAAARALFRALARQIQAQDTHVEDLLFLDLKGRVAKRLLGLVSETLDELPPDGATVPSDVTHADLASLSGGSRENVTRILSDMQRRGFVRRDGRRYVLMKVDALAKLAGL